MRPASLCREWRLLLGLVPGLLVILADAAVLALPSTELTNGLDSDRYRIQWVTGSYAFGFMAGCMITGLVVGQVGLSRCFTGSLLVFAVSSALCAAADTVSAMTPPRLIQGLAVGLALTSSMLLLWERFPAGPAHGMAVYASVVLFGALLGAPLGGLLTSWLSWRWVFLVQLPLGLLAAASAAWALPDCRPAVRAPLRLHFLDLVMTLGWFTCLTVVLDMGQYWGWLDSAQLVLWLAGFVLCAVAFVAWGVFCSGALIGLRLLSVPRYAAAIVVRSVYEVSLYVVIGLLSGYMINLRGYQWWQGSAVLAATLPPMLAALVFGQWVDAPANRPIRLTLGMGAMAWATWCLSAADLYTSKFWTAGLVAVWGAGAGLATVPTIHLLYDGLSSAQARSQAGMFNLSRFLPALLVGAGLATLYARDTDAQMDRMRLRITHNRPPVQQTVAHMRQQFASRSGPSNESHLQSHAALARWVHSNSRAFAFQTVMEYLAILTAGGAALALAVALFSVRPAAPDTAEPQDLPAAPARCRPHTPGEPA